jgi:hypothetical protein
MRRHAIAWLTLLSIAASAGPAAGQMTPGTAQITRVTGPVEARLGGPAAAWAPARVGMRLAEQDELRAFAGGSAELGLPDGSTIVLAENSRFVVSRLRVNPRSQARSTILHLATGKVRAIVTQAALQLVQLRQSTFAISTPAAVAAARGTDIAVTYTTPMAMACRSGTCCCIAASTGIGTIVADGFTSTSGDGFVCSLPRAMTPGEQQLFYATINPAGILHPMMNLPVTILDPTLVESWGCDEPAARLGEEIRVDRFDEPRPESISPFQLRRSDLGR